MDKSSKNRERPEAYPKPTETDLQYKNQTEFLEPDPNRSEEDIKVTNDFQDDNEPRSGTAENTDTRKGV